MNVLQVNKLYYPWIGGVEKVVQQIAEGLTGKDDLQIEVLCCQSKGKRNIEKINGVNIYRASSFGLFWGMPVSLDFFRLFGRIYKKADIIDFHYPFPLAELAIFFFNPKKKIIIHYHSDIFRQRIIKFFLKPLTIHVLKKADKIIVSNENILKNSPYLKKFQKKCEVIHFGVDIEKFQKEVDQREIERIKEKYGKFVLFVGRLNYYKGLEYLVAAMEKIEASLVIIGEGPFRKKAEKKARELKIEDKIFFLSALKDQCLISFYKASMLLALPSVFKSEAFGIVLIEAMACAKPVISTELGTGTSLVNKDGITGFVVPPKDSKSLAIAIKKIIDDDGKMAELGRNAFNRVKKDFSLKKMIRKTLSAYQID